MMIARALAPALSKAIQSLLLGALLFCGAGVWAQGASQEQALHLLDRLAYGAAPGELARVMAMGVDRYVDEQLHPERLALPETLTQQLAALTSTQLSQRDLLTRYRALSMDANNEAVDNEARRAQRTAFFQQVGFDAQEARLRSAIQSPRQLQERMVDFWFNHFNVFRDKGVNRVLIDSYEREAIRPYALGRFRDLLGATARHPAMLNYLDNAQSVAADFRPAFASNAPARASGLNENYARELMELHTLGVDGGYSQRDVTELARMFTGWTYNLNQAEGASVFVFIPRRHDKGEKLWLGERITDQAQAEGEHALDVLARHPATAKHLAYKLAQYFVADSPPMALVNQLSQRFLETQGDISAVLQTLFASAEFRTSAARGMKFKTPYEYVVSAARASALPLSDPAVNLRPLVATLRQLGMPLYGCPTPDGYKNTQAAWLNPEGLSRRIAFATQLASGRLGAISMPALGATPLLDTLGSDVSDKTRSLISQASAPLRAAMVLGSPDFMRH